MNYTAEIKTVDNRIFFLDMENCIDESDAWKKAQSYSDNKGYIVNEVSPTVKRTEYWKLKQYGTS